MKKRVLTLIGFIIVLLLVDWEWLGNLRHEDADFIMSTIQDEVGYELLMITIPLMILQGVMTIFPVILLIIVHFIVYGVVEGFIFSLLGSFLSSILCYTIAKSFSEGYVAGFWKKREKTMNKVMDLTLKYGVPLIVVLRSIPILPSNIISVVAALSPIRFSQYVWSSLWGNISMIWILSLLSAPIILTSVDKVLYIILYALYLVLLYSYYGYQFVQNKQQLMKN